ncbi:hypothetical protein ACVWWQ_003235 [Rhodanobacter sp. TND4EL1]
MKRAAFGLRTETKHRVLRCVLLLLIVLSTAGLIRISTLFDNAKNTARSDHHTAPAASSSPSPVMGDLGGMAVCIPRYYAKHVEYDNDPHFGEASRHGFLRRTTKSRLRSFGVTARFPDMRGLEDSELRSDFRNSQLNRDNPWLRISINAGEFYPKLGGRAYDGLARVLQEKSQYWFDSYERFPLLDVAGLEAYVVGGADPNTGQPARKSDHTKDIYIHRGRDGHVDTYISCGRTSVKGGVSGCQMHFGFGTKAQVDFTVSIVPAMLPRWQSIEDSIYDLFRSFECADG